MIFANDSLIESEKERNLCTKFFAGYFFNEFTPGYTKRIALFNRYIQEVTGREDLKIQVPQVSFDTHAYLLHERLRSKLSDVLVSDPGKQVFLFIETKYLTNWTYAADVAKGVERLEKVFDTEKKPHLAEAKHHYFVLTSRQKEAAAGRPIDMWAQPVEDSYAPSTVLKGIGELKAPALAPVPVSAAPTAAADFTSVLYWEDLAHMCERWEIRQYMEARLKLCISSNRTQHHSRYFLPEVVGPMPKARKPKPAAKAATKTKAVDKEAAAPSEAA